VLLRLLFSTKDSIVLPFISPSFEGSSGTAVVALRLKTRFFVRVIFMRDLHCGSEQLSELFALGTTNEADVHHR